MLHYDRAFFDAQRGVSTASAEVVLPIVWEIIDPKRVVDLGCGSGTWLRVAAGLGAEVVGIDGAYVSDDQLQIPRSAFVAADLEQALPDLGRHDLAICVEVLEHLTPAAGERAVHWLCHSAEAVLFSAAIPGQGGINHVNEQWQSHWAGLFALGGYTPIEVVRPRIWTDERVDFYYRQNMMLFVKAGSQYAKSSAPQLMVDVAHRLLYAPLAARYLQRERRPLNRLIRYLRRRW